MYRGLGSRMRLSLDVVNMYTKPVHVYQTFTRNIAISNKTQMVLNHDNSIIVKAWFHVKIKLF